MNDAEISAYFHDVSVTIRHAQEKTQDHSNDERPTRKVVFEEPLRSSSLFLIFLVFLTVCLSFSHCFKVFLKNMFFSISFLSFLFVFLTFIYYYLSFSVPTKIFLYIYIYEKIYFLNFSSFHFFVFFFFFSFFTFQIFFNFCFEFFSRDKFLLFFFSLLV